MSNPYVSSKEWYLEAVGEPGEVVNMAKYRPIADRVVDSLGGVGGVGGGQGQFKLYARASKLLKFMNRGSTPAIITIYECVCRKDLPLALLPTTDGFGLNAKNLKTFFDNNIVQGNEQMNNNYIPSTYQYNKLNSVSGGFQSHQELNFTPFDVSQFCKFFKIVKVKKAMLSSGHTAYYSLKLGTRKWTDRDINDPQSYGGHGVDTNVVANRGKYKMALISIHGDMAHYDNTGNNTVALGGTGNPQVLTGPVSVDLIVEGKWNWYFDHNPAKPLKAYRFIYANTAESEEYDGGAPVTYDGQKQLFGYDAAVNTKPAASSLVPWLLNSSGTAVVPLNPAQVLVNINAAGGNDIPAGG